MNKTILDSCINFDSIVNFVFDEDDTYSKQLVHYYKSIVLETSNINESKLNKIKEFDSIMYRYIYDHKFRKSFKKEITRFKVERIIEFSDKYYENSIKSFESTIWI